MKKQTASKKVTKEYLSINQKRQGILIETRNTSNPVLLIIHGGPGFPLYPFMSAHQVDLTHHYTVVYWDQPGTGMSGVHTEETIQALADDAYQLIQHLRTKFNQSKVYLMCIRLAPLWVRIWRTKIRSILRPILGLANSGMC